LSVIVSSGSVFGLVPPPIVTVGGVCGRVILLEGQVLDRRREEAEDAAVELRERVGRDAEAERAAVVDAAQRVVEEPAGEREAELRARRVGGGPRCDGVLLELDGYRNAGRDRVRRLGHARGRRIGEERTDEPERHAVRGVTGVAHVVSGRPSRGRRRVRRDHRPAGAKGEVQGAGRAVGNALEEAPEVQAPLDAEAEREAGARLRGVVAVAAARIERGARGARAGGIRGGAELSLHEALDLALERRLKEREREADDAVRQAIAHAVQVDVADDGKLKVTVRAHFDVARRDPDVDRDVRRIDLREADPRCDRVGDERERHGERNVGVVLAGRPVGGAAAAAT
jgi:hypothetical protein